MVQRRLDEGSLRQLHGGEDRESRVSEAIIYEKAPIVMRQLECILGPERLQEGLRVYLREFAFGNATWLDLIHVLDDLTPLDLAAWSRAWVEEPGRPSIRTEVEGRRI